MLLLCAEMDKLTLQLQKQCEKEVDSLQARVKSVQERAGTMSAVIATILGIGLPLLIQPETKHYFHVLPFLLLLSSFILFYMAFSRGITYLDIKDDYITTEDGKQYYTPQREKYKPNNFERLLGAQYVLIKNQPTDIRDRLEKVLFWRTALSQWAHSFFLSSILVETLKVKYPGHTLLDMIFFGLLSVVLVTTIKYFVFLKIQGNQTTTFKIKL